MCPFKLVKWPIAVWPRIQKAKELLDVEENVISRSISEGSQVAGPSGAIDAGEIESLGESVAPVHGGENPPLQTFQTHPMPRMPFNWNALATHEENYQFDSLVPFENAISNPDRTLVSLASTRVELRSAIVREAGFIPRLQAVIEERKIAMEELLERVDRAYALAKRKDNNAYEAAERGLEMEGAEGGSVGESREERE